jgi:hypothetical protein
VFWQRPRQDSQHPWHRSVALASALLALTASAETGLAQWRVVAATLDLVTSAFVFSSDRDGKIMTSTLPQSFPSDHLHAIGDHVLASFRSAKKAQTPLAEIVINYSALKLMARELRGGAIIFLMPQSLNQRQNSKIKKSP